MTGVSGTSIYNVGLPLTGEKEEHENEQDFEDGEPEFSFSKVLYTNQVEDQSGSEEESTPNSRTDGVVPESNETSYGGSFSGERSGVVIKSEPTHGETVAVISDHIVMQPRDIPWVDESSCES